MTSLAKKETEVHKVGTGTNILRVNKKNRKKKCSRPDSNQRPFAYEANALPLSYASDLLTVNEKCKTIYTIIMIWARNNAVEPCSMKHRHKRTRKLLLQASLLRKLRTIPSRGSALELSMCFVEEPVREPETSNLPHGGLLEKSILSTSGPVTSYWQLLRIKPYNLQWIKRNLCTIVELYSPRSNGLGFLPEYSRKYVESW